MCDRWKDRQMTEILSLCVNLLVYETTKRLDSLCHILLDSCVRMYLSVGNVYKDKNSVCGATEASLCNPLE